MFSLPKTALALLAAASLSAGDFTGGLQLGPAFSMGDLKTLTDSRVGLNLVLFGLFDLGGGNAIRLRLDGTAFSGYPQTFPTPLGPLPLGGNFQVTASTSGFGADYLHYLEGSRNRGAYLGGGLSFNSNKIEFRADLPGADVTGEQSTGALGFGLYAGYQFNRHWQTELAFKSSQFNKTLAGTKFSYSMPAVALSAGYTF